MKLYRINTTAGPRWFGTQADAKAGTKELGGGSYEQVEVPTDKPNLLIWLNEQMATDVRPEPRRLDELEEAELRAVAEADTVVRDGLIHYDYSSPFSARTILASIDASMCVKAIAQFHGENLRKVVSAGIDRVSQLLGAAPGGTDG